MIKSLSSHYKTIPWISPSSGIVPDKCILNIYVWSGYKSNVPVTPKLMELLKVLNLYKLIQQ